MTPNEYEELLDTIKSLKKVYKEITEDQIISCLNVYIKVRRPVMPEDIIDFVRMMKELNNI